MKFEERTIKTTMDLFTAMEGMIVAARDAGDDRQSVRNTVRTSTSIALFEMLWPEEEEHG